MIFLLNFLKTYILIWLEKYDCKYSHLLLIFFLYFLWKSTVIHTETDETEIYAICPLKNTIFPRQSSDPLRSIHQKLVEWNGSETIDLERWWYTHMYFRIHVLTLTQCIFFSPISGRYLHVSYLHTRLKHQRKHF